MAHDCNLQPGVPIPVTMSPVARTVLLVLIAVGLAAGAAGLRPTEPAEGGYPSARGDLRYGPEASATDRELVSGAIARARPESREILNSVLGAVTIQIGSPAEGVAGEARQRGDRFTVELSLGLIYRLLGRQGTDRLVLHELGHVVDWMLTPAPLDTEIDAMTPRGYGCEDGVGGACANERERFAEGYSKWSTGDIGAQAGAVLGYRVPPPSDLERWGAVLVQGIRDR